MERARGPRSFRGVAGRAVGGDDFGVRHGLQPVSARDAACAADSVCACGGVFNVDADCDGAGAAGDAEPRGVAQDAGMDCGGVGVPDGRA